MPLFRTEAPDLEGIDVWVNSEPINLEEGVFILYFWNYSCKCCRERAETLERISQNYRDISLIGVHSPKHDFEKDEKNLKKSVETLEINHGVAHDVRSEVSDELDLAYSTQLLVISEGTIVAQHLENNIEPLVEKINELLETDSKPKEVSSRDTDNSLSHQFFGYSRAKGLGQYGNYPGEKVYELPSNRKRNTVYLKGKWEQTEDYIEAREGSELWFNLESSELDLIIDPDDSIKDVKIRVNNQPVPEKDAGEDLRLERSESYVRVKNPDLYSIIDSDEEGLDVKLIPEKGARLYALTYR